MYIIVYIYVYIYLRAAALAADPGKECEEAEGGPRPRFCFLVAAESNGSCKGIGLPRVGDLWKTVSRSQWVRPANILQLSQLPNLRHSH